MGIDRDRVIAAYETLVALAAREHALAAAGDIAALLAVQDARAELVAGLPVAPPARARPLLERAAALQAATTETLRAGLDDTIRELGRLRNSRAAVQGYTPGSAPSASADHAA